MRVHGRTLVILNIRSQWASMKMRLNKNWHCTFKRDKNILSCAIVGKYDTTKTVIVDPFVSSTSNLTGLNAGKPKDIDFDYTGNIYVTGGGDGATKSYAQVNTTQMACCNGLSVVYLLVRRGNSAPISGVGL